MLENTNKSTIEWREEAARVFPELSYELSECDSPMGLWIEVNLLFNQAYEHPVNEDLIRRVYQFADWCLTHDEENVGAGEHLPTCVCVAFYEHIPICAPALADMPRWFSREDVLLMKQIFSYHTSEKDYENLLALFRSSDGKETRKQRKARLRREAN
jgi:hypothetical protein